MRNKLKIIDEFLNSLESEQLKEGQDVMLLSGASEKLKGAIGVNSSRCINGTTACIGSINDSKCSNGSCNSSINGRKCTTVNQPDPDPKPTPTPSTGA